MAINQYFAQGRISEQRLYEDLIIEALKIYGQDVYYLPRELVNRDNIFQDDIVSKFDNSYKIEMYIENIEGFDGDGDLFTKFGVEIRDAATFVVSRRRFRNIISIVESTVDKQFFRPREGDLIFLPLSRSIFEITHVTDETPFYQLKNLPVYRMRCELFEYNDENFDTGVVAVDAVENAHAQQTTLVFNQNSITGTFEFSEFVQQVNNTFTINGEIVDIDASDSSAYKLFVAHVGATDGLYHDFTLTNPVVGLTSTASGTPYSINEKNLRAGAQNNLFDSAANNILDFSESNPFGDPI